jgi:hypothetical protein
MTLNKIRAGLNKTLKQIDKLVAANKALIENNDTAIERLATTVGEYEDHSAELKEESKQAQVFGENIKKLLGVENERV